MEYYAKCIMATVGYDYLYWDLDNDCPKCPTDEEIREYVEWWMDYNNHPTTESLTRGIVGTIRLRETMREICFV